MVNEAEGSSSSETSIHILKGIVTKVYDGIFEAYGLKGARSGQIISFPRVKGFGAVLSLSADKVIGTYFGVNQGQIPAVEDVILGTSDLPSLYPTYKLLGRVIDPFGRFLDIPSSPKNNHASSSSRINVKLSHLL